MPYRMLSPAIRVVPFRQGCVSVVMSDRLNVCFFAWLVSDLEKGLLALDGFWAFQDSCFDSG